MMNEKTRFDLEWWLTLHRREKGVWPGSAFELGAFAKAHGRSVDWTSFHTIHFAPLGPSRMKVDYTLRPGGDGWAEGGTLVLATKSEEDLQWRSVGVASPRRPVQIISFCEREERFRAAV